MLVAKSKTYTDLSVFMSALMDRYSYSQPTAHHDSHNTCTLGKMPDDVIVWYMSVLITIST